MKSIFKKILSIFIAIVCILSVVSLDSVSLKSYASGEMISVDCIELTMDELRDMNYVVTVDTYISGNTDGLSGLKIGFENDSRLTLLDYGVTGIISSQSKIKYTDESGYQPSKNLLWLGLNAKANVITGQQDYYKGDGKLYYITYRIPQDAKPGNIYSIVSRFEDENGVKSKISTGTSKGEVPFTNVADGYIKIKYEETTTTTTIVTTTTTTTTTTTSTTTTPECMVHINFDANGGSCSISSKELWESAYSTYGSLPIPVRTGYTFTGWYTSKTGGDKITENTKVYYGRYYSYQTLYAHWIENTTTTTTTAMTTTKPTTMTTTTTSKLTTTTIENELQIDETSITLRNGEQYQISANQNNLTYKSNNTDVAIVSKKGIVTAIGEGTATISVINSDADVVQLKVKVISANGISGDLNQDNAITISDTVIFQKYILGIQTLTQEQAKCADLTKDGIVNIFDLSVLKYKLFS